MRSDPAFRSAAVLLFLFLLEILISPGRPPACAQTTGGIEGTVTDANDAPLPGASVELRSPSLQGVRSAVTNSAGRGLLRCACGSAFTPASTRRGRREYRYYRCIRKDKEGKEACPSSPLPADAIESYVIERLREVAAEGTAAGIGTPWVARCLENFDSIWDVLTPQNRGRLVRAVVDAVEVDEPSNKVKVFIVEPGYESLTAPDPERREVPA